MGYKRAVTKSEKKILALFDRIEGESVPCVIKRLCRHPDRAWDPGVLICHAWMQNAVRRLLLPLALLPLTLLAWSAQAQVSLSWELPTRLTYCVDSGPVLDRLVGARVYRLVADVPADTTTWQIHTDTVGEQRYAVAAYTVAAEAVVSAEASVTVTRFEAPAGTRVYALAQSTDTLTLYPVGLTRTVAACDAETVVMGRHLVPVDSVRWVGSQRPSVVFAACRPME